MPEKGSVSNWIDGIKQGDEAAAQAIWDRYFQDLVHFARQRLARHPRRDADEEDVALSALAAFCRKAQDGSYPDLAERDGLWRLLTKITADKAADQVKTVGRSKRGGGRVKGESALGGSRESRGVGQIVGHEPSPEFIALLNEQLQRLLANLPDDRCRAIARLKLEGHTDMEIAKQIPCGLRTVERAMTVIHKRWQQECES